MSSPASEGYTLIAVTAVALEACLGLGGSCILFKAIYNACCCPAWSGMIPWGLDAQLDCQHEVVYSLQVNDQFRQLMIVTEADPMVVHFADIHQVMVGVTHDFSLHLSRKFSCSDHLKHASSSRTFCSASPTLLWACLFKASEAMPFDHKHVDGDIQTSSSLL